MSEQQQELSSSVRQFSQDFYKATASLQPNKNLIMSPLSAEIALAMLSLGATGETQKELNTALHLKDSDFTRAAFRPAIDRLNAVEGITLKVANKVYVKEGANYVLASQFKKDSVDVFNSETQNLNFAQSKASADTINAWVEDKTNNKIKDLIDPDSLTADTRAVLVNAIYFKGSWDKKFKVEDTRKRDFFLTANNKKQVDMMHKVAEFRYADLPELNAKVLELPYEKHQASMLIFLPNEVEGLSALEAKLSSKDVDVRNIIQNMYKAEVTVALPKFRIETTIDLKEVLPKLGINRIFDDRAELGNVLESHEPLFVSEAIQKAFIEVNEEGAEAAAATGAAIRKKRSCFSKVSADFVCDHPSLSIIASVGNVSEEMVPLFAARLGLDFGAFDNFETKKDLHVEL